MRRPVEWVERDADGLRVRIRVVFHGTHSIAWARRREDEERWTHGFEPTFEQWDFLLRKVEDRYRRRAASWEDVLRVRAWRREAGGEAAEV